MSNISDEKIKQLSSDVQKLKNECLTHINNSNNEMAINCLKQIKIKHGESIKLLCDLSTKTNISNEDDKIKLSNSSCLVDLIKMSLDKCVTKIYNVKSNDTVQKPTSDTQMNPVTISIGVESSDIKNIPNTEIPSVKTIPMTGGKYNFNAMTFSEMSDDSSFIETSSNLTDFIDGLNTAKANKLFSTDTKITVEKMNLSDIQSGGFNLNPELPTLVNFWKDNCGHSTRYQETWSKIKNSLMKSHPDLQLAEINASNYPGMFDKLQKIGIVGYPTTVLFKGSSSKEHVKIVGNLSLEEVVKTVNDNM